ncbi:MAG: site-specific DNA-methyltransferase [Schwartzia sp.]|nr:site-specific DNA-methyltransferase [Schwartzia sp. (in: firmicutes)]MBR1553183.1 site-specific DNA-methyltransferase [Schwartzia sp. (in: firmicutes)]MBR1886574.1 site-specific DNA-methyltransferase [Schwartzia sp. (in: firmicutes)]
MGEICETRAGNVRCETHPAIFSGALARDHIISWSPPGDVVLDPFSGSGTTAKMAKLTGREYIGFDISEEYCEIARKRLATANPVRQTDTRATSRKSFPKPLIFST